MYAHNTSRRGPRQVPRSSPLKHTTACKHFLGGPELGCYGTACEPVETYHRVWGKFYNHWNNVFWRSRRVGCHEATRSVLLPSKVHKEICYANFKVNRSMWLSYDSQLFIYLVPHGVCSTGNADKQLQSDRYTIGQGQIQPVSLGGGRFQ